MMKGSFDNFVVSAHHGQPAAALAEAPVDTLSGVSAADAARLSEAFGIRTIGDLAGNRYVAAARAIAEAAADPGHDRGPDAGWTAFFAQAPLAVYQANPDDFRLDFGPVWYRGRLDGTARLLVVGQDPAANELVGHRIFVGTSGQRVQGFLTRLGITRDYLMINTFLYPVFGQFFQLEALSHDPRIEGFRNALLDRIAKRNALEAVVAVGSAARDAIERWPGRGSLPFHHITHPSAPNHAAVLQNWNDGVAVLQALVDAELGVTPDPTAYAGDWTDADHVPIPRRDLPFGVPEWHGNGTRATRGRKPDNSTDHKLILWSAP
jgi:hypothetical protein